MLIARELRHLGNLRGADELLAQVLLTTQSTRPAPMRWRSARSCACRQQRHREALADLRAADESYAALELDFNRIDTSSALALGLLDAGDLAGAGAAADTAVAIETAHSREVRESRVACAFPVGELHAIRGAHRGRPGRGVPADHDAMWRAFRTAEAIRARSLADRLAHGAPRRRDAA